MYLSRFLSSHLSILQKGTFPNTTGLVYRPIILSNPYVRCYSSSITDWWSIPRYQYTKYRITKPWSETTQYEDIFLTQPSKDDFAKFTKDTPLFLRFLKLVTDLEGRTQAFVDFTKKCSDGLVVEKDVYLTKKELMDCIWKNGYSESEMNAFEIAFPADYQFHYPELAALFDISEEDCYKFCLRQRANNPTELVELNYTSPPNLVSAYGIVFTGLWLGLSNSVLGNAWFLSKTIPFGAVFWLLATYFYKDMKNYFWAEEATLLDTARNNKVTGEELVYTQMKKYSNDSRAVTFLSAFKDDVQAQLAQYHAAIGTQYKNALNTKLTQKLNAIQKAENDIQNSLQETIVNQVVNSFKTEFAQDPSMQDAAFKSALAMLSNDPTTPLPPDPINEHFKKAFQEIQGIDFNSPEAHTSPNQIISNIATVFQQKEKEFLDSFTVKAEEADQVKSIVSKCTTNGTDFDFSQLTQSEYSQLEKLYKTINQKVGFEVPDESHFKPIISLDEKSQEYIQYINSEIDKAVDIIKKNRLTAFAQAFA